ncbi:DNA-binding SARP family transcriptional activator [Allocatelliglobosispora scoriae]|uniref:DNA-binding SARP family transcriptional activator n=1 Tax=Allocatelliglobosispora scoriae TaxID=643052 RepID=A0A841BWP4_9ACTN|nr:BTAD domain-containing putative transcriptional regulator [Allocatelliglobosispora scoriae]MBB5873537.1 DNA-binding SARP family transcriptional activator [Allocatelliglobosispora scoriae]
MRLLGAVEVAVGDEVRPVPGLRRKAVLAMLGLHPGQVVSSDRLIDVVWAEDAPATALNTLQRHISYLRDLLGAKEFIMARSSGYLLALGDEATDVLAAERLIRAAKRASDPHRRVEGLRAALALWRGRPLTGVTALRWFGEQAERLDDMERDAMRALAEARLELGEHQALIPELERLLADRPLDEGLCRLLMTALYRSGRQAASLERFQQLRQVLAEELGIDPSQPLRELETAILRQDPALDPPIRVAVVAGTPVPAQLPLATRGFAPRHRELARLDAMLAESRDAGSMMVTVVSGTAGAGKTSLAVHWAHQVRGSFPDGQLYVDLRGFGGDARVDPPAVLRRFLDAYGVPGNRIPAGPDELAAFYRTMLADRRVLIVLDNARDVEQVRPLLPGSPGCAVLVTSRNQLTGLVAVEGAQSITLGLLTDDEARDLLTRRIGAGRVAAEAVAVRDMITLCARLPLALALAAASCVTRPDLAVGEVTTQLRATAGPFDALRSVFSWSYQAVSPAAARLFRLLGLHPGPSFTVPAAATLTGLDVAVVRPLLAELIDANLIQESILGRYRFHDLLWAYALDRAGSDESQAARHAAGHRLLDHYLHTSVRAAMLLTPHRQPLTGLLPPLPGVTLAEPVTRDASVAWFTDERSALQAMLRRAAAEGFDTHAWQLAWAVQDFLDRWGHWDDQVANQLLASDAAARLGQRAAEGHAHISASTTYARLGDNDRAQDHLRRALDLFADLGDLGSQAKVQYQLGWLANRQGRHEQAVRHARQALRLYRAAGQPMMAARTLNSLGWGYALSGDFARARPRCELALAQMRELGDLAFQAGTSDSLGYINHHLGNYDLAIAHYLRAIELYQGNDDRYYEADVLDHLGDSYRAAGDTAAARSAWTQAVEILDQLGHLDADRVRIKLGS